VEYDEFKDYNSSLLFSGGIDPANLPKTLKNGKCVAVYPHARLRVNTVFEVVHAAGYETAYTDKHPAYDIVRGPSGKGLSEGYFPEIAAVANNVAATIAYDQLHVNAFLGWIDGQSQPHAEGSISKMPTLFGGNFQAVSVAQKTKGYNKDLSFTPDLLQAIDFVDDSLGKVVAKLKSKSLLHETLIIVASKHGQAPINPALYNTVDPDAVTNATGVPVAFQTVRILLPSTPPFLSPN
jgi:predicted AlkP superfamily pyrophosphatase or phosphodiesterase